MKLNLPEKKVKVVLDTNVVISAAIATEGIPAHIFELVLLEKIENYTTEEIIKEIGDVFQRPKILKLITREDMKFFLTSYALLSKRVVPQQKFALIRDDPDDNKFIECAVEAGAAFIISGDPHLVNIKAFRTIKIVTPREFLSFV